MVLVKLSSYLVQGILATSRALGDYPLKDQKLITAEPDVLHFDLAKVRAPRLALLATDGLWDALSNDAAAAFTLHKTPGRWTAGTDGGNAGALDGGNAGSVHGTPSSRWCFTSFSQQKFLVTMESAASALPGCLLQL